MKPAGQPPGPTQWKPIRVSLVTHKRLTALATERAKETGKPVSYGDVVEMLLHDRAHLTMLLTARAS